MTKVYFTNGEFDPKISLGVTKDLNKEAPADVIPCEYSPEMKRRKKGLKFDFFLQYTLEERILGPLPRFLESERSRNEEKHLF